MKPVMRAVAVLTFLVALAGTMFGQTALTQTTLAAAVNGPTLYSGNSNALQTQVTLTSVTGVNGPVLGSQPTTLLYVGKEAMAVMAVNSTTKVVQVLRAYGGVGAPHPNGDMVLIGAIASSNPALAQGGNPVAGFFEFDPSGNCTASATQTTPWINISTGAQWLCSTLTNTWVPGFGNPGNSGTPNAMSAAVASATTLTPSGPLFHITGSTAVTTIGIPIGFNATAVGGGQFCVIPDNATAAGFTAGNNIAISTTFVVNKLLCMTWDATNSKFVPTY